MVVTEQYVRGLKDRAAGKPRYYGCHVGMRLTLEEDRTEYFRGWDEMAAYLNSELRRRRTDQEVFDDYAEECKADCERTGRF